METAPRPRALGRSGPRTRNGCLTCRRRKVRCDQATARVQERRHCDNCARLELDCRYADANPRRNKQRPAGRQGTPAHQNVGAAPQEATYGRQNAVQHSRGPNQQPDQADNFNSVAPASQMPQENSSGNDIDLLPAEPENLPFFSGYVDWTQPPFSFDFTSPWDSIFSVPVPGSKESYIELPPTNASTTGRAPTRGDHQNDGIAASALPSGGLKGHRQPQTASHGASTSKSMANAQAGERGHHQAEDPDQMQRMAAGSIDLSLFNVTQHQSRLLLHFGSKVNPIPLISPTDSQWRSAYTSLISMACGCSYLINAICAVAELSLVKTGKGSVAQALKFYQAAHARVEPILCSTEHRTNDRSLKQAFAALLLLMHTEIFAPSLAAEHGWPRLTLRSAHRHLKCHGERMRRWSGLGSHLLTWIQLVDSKAVYAAGMDKQDRVLATDTVGTAADSPARANSYSIAADHATPSLTSPIASTGSTRFVAHAESSERLQPEEEDQPDSEDDGAPVSAAEIAYDALYQPAYQFFVRCHCIIPHIIALDLHHRKRGPLDAEIEVLQAGQRLRSDLRELWRNRPRELAVLDDAEGLEQVLHLEVAEKIMRNFRSFVANFYAIKILLHRVAFTHFPASDEVHQAVSEILRLADDQTLSAQTSRTGEPYVTIDNGNVSPHKDRRRADAGFFVGDDERIYDDAAAGDTAHSASAHVREPGQGQGQTLDETPEVSRNLDSSGTIGGVPDGSGGPPPGAQISDAARPGALAQRTSSELRPDTFWLWPLFMAGTECSVAERPVIMAKITAMESRNAQRTARLLAELTKTQDELKKRVDQRSVRQRIFADEFDLVY